jgi:dTDP-glucose 4,6-dehydratase
MRILLTGGAGFIGTALCRHLLVNTTAEILVLDKLTYAANVSAIDEFKKNERYSFVQADICNHWKVDCMLRRFRPDALINLAAESHVDRSIQNAIGFVETNISGTMVLLEAVRRYLASLDERQAQAFRFLHVSTDEVFGDLGVQGNREIFKEDTPYYPSSPYAASKAASDHLVRAWCRTYRIPAMVTNCTNNYGPGQYPEKLIPLVCRHAINRWAIPVYGDGSQIRDWIHVDDHARALLEVLDKGVPGDSYVIGARNEWRNLDLVRLICRTFDVLAPANAPHESLIRYVADRPGHDRRYAVDPQKLENQTGWRAEVEFESGIRQTVRSYLENAAWPASNAPETEWSPQMSRASA